MREILTYPNPVLSETSTAVETVNAQLIDDMFEAMYAGHGVGLAAPQVGVLDRVIVADVTGADPVAVVNPVIEEALGAIESLEGCLSVPGYQAKVMRAAQVVVTGLDRDGRPLRLEAEGLLGVCLQHEIDHLEGVLFIDRLSRLKQDMAKRKLRKRAKTG
jgi:peptide deformylase